MQSIIRIVFFWMVLYFLTTSIIFAEGNHHYEHAKELFKQNNFDQSLVYFEKSLALDLEQNGENHPSVGYDYFEIAKVLQRKFSRPGYFDYNNELSDKSLVNYKNALAIFIYHYGSNSEEVQNIFWNIGTLYHNRDEYGKSIKYKLKSLKVLEETSTDERYFSLLWKSLGLSYQMNQEHDLAVNYFEKSLSVDLKFNDSLYPPHVNLYLQLGESYTALNKYNKAIQVYEKALSIYKKTRPDHPHVSMIEQKLSSIR